MSKKKNSKKKGLFIAFDGPDGSGKTTATRSFVEELKKKGVNSELTREPGGTKIGEEIRNILLDNNNTEMAPLTEAFLYTAGRAQHIEEKIKPLLKKGVTVVTDRFVISSLAYQGEARGLGIKKVKKINDYALNGLTPDITFFFAIDYEEALNRKFIGRTADRIENEGSTFHKKIYKGYQKAIKNEKNVVVIDASKSPEEIVQQCLEAYEDFLKGNL